MKNLLALAFLLLVSALSAIGQAVPKTVHLVGGCTASAEETVAIFKSAKTAPQFDLYIVCNPADWHSLAMKNDFKESSHSFTVLHHGMIWLGPKAIANLHEAIEHELQHLRCDCDLGENH